ncbi:hypothetical protein H0H92_012020 [Tricholoma furcatifolium]|nr:hypothetical protein H0H92_012020 [Tricholoma furcatifolium]
MPKASALFCRDTPAQPVDGEILAEDIAQTLPGLTQQMLEKIKETALATPGEMQAGPSGAVSPAVGDSDHLSTSLEDQSTLTEPTLALNAAEPQVGRVFTIEEIPLDPVTADPEHPLAKHYYYYFGYRYLLRTDERLSKAQWDSESEETKHAFIFRFADAYCKNHDPAFVSEDGIYCPETKARSLLSPGGSYPRILLPLACQDQRVTVPSPISDPELSPILVDELAPAPDALQEATWLVDEAGLDMSSTVVEPGSPVASSIYTDSECGMDADGEDGDNPSDSLDNRGNADEASADPGPDVDNEGGDGPSDSLDNGGDEYNEADADAGPDVDNEGGNGLSDEDALRLSRWILHASLSPRNSVLESTNSTIEGWNTD